MRTGRSRQRTYTLRNAASVVFALTAVIPLLLLTYTLYSLGQLDETQAQLGLGAALLCALVGLVIFSRLMGRLSEVLRFVEAQGEREAPTAAVVGAVEAVPGSATTAPADPATAPRATAPPARAGSAPGPAPRIASGGIVVPGLGTITAGRRDLSAARHAADAFDEMQKTMWRAEAQRHLGVRVLVTVKNAAEPIEGSLAQITEDGVLLEQDHQRVAISYLRITNIEPDRRPTAGQ